YLLDLVHERLRRIGEQQMRLVEEEHELWFRRISDLRKLLKELGQHPQEKRGVEPRALHQSVGGENIDETPAIAVCSHKILQRQCRFAEELRPTLIFQHQKLTLNGSDRCAGNVAEGLCRFADRPKRIGGAIGLLFAAI